MALKCLLGHSFGQKEQKKTTESSPEGEYTKTQTVQKCKDCGQTRVLSENKTVESPKQDEGESPTTPSAPSQSSAVSPSAAMATDGSGITSEGRTDGGIILDDNTDDTKDEGPEDSPRQTDATQSNSTDTSSDTVSSSDDGVHILDSPTKSGEDKELSDPTLPEEDSQRQSEARNSTGKSSQYGTSGSTGVGAAEVRDQCTDAVVVEDSPQSESEAQTPTSDSPSGPELVCPTCGFRTPANSGSRWEGDGCPKCSKNFLELQE